MNKPAIQQIISIDYDLASHHKVLYLKQERRFSELINSLLRAYLAVEKEDVPDELEELEKELYKLEAKKAVILEKKAEMEKHIPKLTEQEKLDGWFIMDGQKYKKVEE